MKIPPKLPILLPLLLLLITQITPTQILSQIPIKFKLSGNINYTPTSGGVDIPGYILTIGYNKYSWIGIKFLALTSRSTYDILVMQRQSAPVGGYYKITVKDYFVAAARQDKLLPDSNNNMDKEVIGYSPSNYMESTIYRTKGNTQGQDWQGGDFVDICFYTSDQPFNQNVWTGLSESCYGYDVSRDYVSTFRGRYIGSMGIDGIAAKVYGGIQGPVLRMELFWYCPKSGFSSPDVYLRIGQKISSDLGYDYHKCGTGDFFGLTPSTLTSDTTWSGYNDGTCTITSSTTPPSTKLSYIRKINTYDQYDSTLYKSNEICVTIGTGGEVCKTMELDVLFPVMTVDSMLVVWETGLFLGVWAVVGVLGLGLV